mmetsp:Transcript_41944/g.131444  ORF Transcript_41944/g.131444 Transcript_41944/m.131444 type:complete len:203 (+) Transcript_41944:1475-2083(+)
MPTEYLRDSEIHRTTPQEQDTPPRRRLGCVCPNTQHRGRQGSFAPVAVLPREERLARADESPGGDAAGTTAAGAAAAFTDDGTGAGDTSAGTKHRRGAGIGRHAHPGGAHAHCGVGHTRRRLGPHNGLANRAGVGAAGARRARAEEPAVDALLVEVVVARQLPQHVAGLEGLEADGAAILIRLCPRLLPERHKRQQPDVLWL